MPSRADHKATLKYYEEELAKCKNTKFGLWSYEDIINLDEDLKNLMSRDYQHTFSIGMCGERYILGTGTFGYRRLGKPTEESS
jgi:hypothetical protein